ncbi:nitronate monooxygenase [Halobacteria archaeon HArc-gm2]|nr:nitronate monooxygenase [Halobacteria archaeon HArc-gm2]
MVRLSTDLTELLDLDVPVVQAPIGSATCADLAANVANAGGLGTLAVTWRDVEETREVVAESPDGDPISRYEDSLAVPGTTGDVDEVPLFAGQSAGLADETVSAADLIATLADETRTSLDQTP